MRENTSARMPREDELDTLDAAALEDLDVDDHADAGRGGTTCACPTSH